MTYRLVVKPSAKKQMRRLPDNVFRRVDARVRALRDDPRPPDTQKLVESLWWRVRVGGYRIIYEIDDHRLLVRILAVKPRQSAYR